MKIYLLNFFIIFWIISILLLVFSILTLFFERKYIAILQKRLGISMLGRNGWIHLPADLLKFWIKKSLTYSNNNNNKYLGFFFTLCFYFLWNILFCLFFTNNGSSTLLQNFKYSIFLYFSMTGLTSIYMFNLIINLKSKYALISALRVNICSIFLEFVFALSYIYLYMVILGFSLNNIKHNTGFINYTFINTFSSIFILTYVLFESKRAPFDHTESESELVAGHIIEFGGRNLLIFYFSEYVHFFFISYWLLLLVINIQNHINIPLIILIINYQLPV